MVEPHEVSSELFITDQLDDLQETVGGLIEVIGNGDGTLLVCNEESKLNGMDGNRRLNGDVIAGPFFVVGEDGENFRLSQMKKCRNICSALRKSKISHRRSTVQYGLLFFLFIMERMISNESKSTN